MNRTLVDLLNCSHSQCAHALDAQRDQDSYRLSGAQRSVWATFNAGLFQPREETYLALSEISNLVTRSMSDGLFSAFMIAKITSRTADSLLLASDVLD